MNVFTRPLIQVFVVFVCISSSLSQASDIGAEPAFLTDDSSASLEHDVGYLVKRSLLDDNFFSYAPVQKLFNKFKADQGGGYHVSAEMKETFKPLVETLAEFIDDNKKGIMSRCEDRPQNCETTFKEINGISETQMAAEIVKASYCFGTDPMVVSAKIRQESRFDMFAVSHTGAVGLTQMTSPGIKEILDQLGNRGAKYAFIENKDFLEKAINCYAGQAMPFVFKDFPEIETYQTKNGGLEYTSETIQKLKKWLLPPDKKASQTTKIAYIKRQIFMGQILLKIYLAYSKQVRPQNAILKHYDSALRMFNGDNIRVQYAKEVMRYSRINML